MKVSLCFWQAHLGPFFQLKKKCSCVLMLVSPPSVLLPHRTNSHNELSQFSKNWLNMRVFWFSSQNTSKGMVRWLEIGSYGNKHVINWIHGLCGQKKSVSCFHPHLRPTNDINICFYRFSSFSVIYNYTEYSHVLWTQCTFV